jgi:hypothetical protein
LLEAGAPAADFGLAGASSAASFRFVAARPGFGATGSSAAGSSRAGLPSALPRRFDLGSSRDSSARSAASAAPSVARTLAALSFAGLGSGGGAGSAGSAPGAPNVGVGRA